MEYKTVWLSDLHLGTRGCDAEKLLDFLRRTECRTLYLVGDIVDLWSLKREHYWPQAHNDVIQKILRKARKGTRVIYIPGNHDEFGGRFLGVYGNVWIKPRDLYVTGHGKRLLVMHGHEFDAIMQHSKWLANLGDIGYQLLLGLNRPLNALRRTFGREPWSLSAYAKSRVKNAVNFISRFEEAVVRYAQMYDADGIVCGHIHTPVTKRIRDVAYYNSGDWVESSTALVETHAGTIELVRWRETEAVPSLLPTELAVV
ncbi:MAG TPA: UDP-2,3-diacylglucosamine diphosphatase [Verrucomicrobiae bacterium]|nr:UDP-2,3-diacylglucosamine diphosphatase [Verrucomicrobiae bacterium]